MKETMSTKEFAQKLGVSSLTVRKWISEGKIKPLKTVSGRYRFTEEHIKQALLISNELNESEITISSTMSTEEFARRIGVSSATVRRWIYEGKIKPLRTVSGRYRFTEEHLKQALLLKSSRSF